MVGIERLENRMRDGHATHYSPTKERYRRHAARRVPFGSGGCMSASTNAALASGESGINSRSRRIASASRSAVPGTKSVSVYRRAAAARFNRSFRSGSIRRSSRTARFSASATPMVHSLYPATCRSTYIRAKRKSVIDTTMLYSSCLYTSRNVRSAITRRSTSRCPP